LKPERFDNKYSNTATSNNAVTPRPSLPPLPSSNYAIIKIASFLFHAALKNKRLHCARR